MGVAIQPLTLEEFRSKYSDGVKPYVEYWDGTAMQKAVPTKLHALLQWLLAGIFDELGFHSFTELTLRISPDWEPIPDVVATVEAIAGPYPTVPVEVVAEVLSPDDSFEMVASKCERYAAIGIREILVFDPGARRVWRWDRGLHSLIRVMGDRLPLLDGRYQFDLEAMWKRFEAKSNRA